MVRFIRLVLPLLLALAWTPALAASLVMDGRMDSQVDYTLTYHVSDTASSRMFSLSVVEPKPYASLTSKEDVLNFSLRFTPEPDEQSRTTDNRGNTILTGTWNSPPVDITLVYSLGASTHTVLQEVRSTAPFPPERPPLDVRIYQEPSTQIQSESKDIKGLAAKLTSGAMTSWDAVRLCIIWIVDNIRYVSDIAKYDALSTLVQGKGNCQNFSHLAAALLRSLGLPVRIVNGITLDRPYDVETKGLIFTTKMALGRHSWIEVWFPDLGWAPFDPQNSLLFVANRYLRCEVGLDNLDTDQDGRMAWIQNTPTGPRPRLREEHAVAFKSDDVHLTGQLLDLGSRMLLRQPRVGLLLASLPPGPEPGQITPAPTPAEPTAVLPSGPTPTRLPGPQLTPSAASPKTPGQKQVVTPEKPHPVSPDKLPKPSVPAAPRAPQVAEPPAKGKTPRYNRPFLAGNLEYPQDLDFTRTRSTKRTGTNTYQSTRTFLVESAQYVTTNLTQYAQLFQLAEPIRLNTAGLALHRYGGNGQLWLELRADDRGLPGKLLATSDIVDLSTLSLRPGYRWTNFSFARDTPQLNPGDYWLALGFTGDAVVNWFYSYGKPVGPAYGTRYKSALAKEWSGALSYEFNYRVQGLAVGR
jgi:transglutaminase-like putative cysteine protease